MGQEPRNTQQLLDRLAQAGEDRDKVSVRMMVESVGSGSFGPLLLLAGLMLASPVSGIPGAPTTFGVLVLFISLQMLFRRPQFWLPNWVLNRSVGRERFLKGLKFLRPPARFIDRGLRQRLTVFVRGTGQTVIAIVCILISLCTPIMELVPFSASSAGVALAIFGLAIVSHDGLLALSAFVVTVAIFWFIYSAI